MGKGGKSYGGKSSGYSNHAAGSSGNASSRAPAVELSAVVAQARAVGVPVPDLEAAATVKEQAEIAAKWVVELTGLRNAQLELRKLADDARRDAEQLQKSATAEKVRLELEGKVLAELERRTRNEATLLEAQRVKAEDGFLEERRRILSGVEGQLETLRKERAALTTTLELQRQRETDALLAELERERRERTRALREELQAERARYSAEVAEQEERAETLRKELVASKSELRRLHVHAEAEGEILAEDRKNFDLKVQRFATEQVANIEEEVRTLELRLGSAIAQRDHSHSELEAHRELERQLGGRSATALLEELEALKRKGSELETELRLRPGQDLADRVQFLEKQRLDWEQKRMDLEVERARDKATLAQVAVAAVDLQREAKLNEINQVRLRQQQAHLDALSAEVEKATKADQNRSPFEGLLDIDRDPEAQRSVFTSDPFEAKPRALSGFVTDLRARMARSLSSTGEESALLNYSESDLRCWLSGLAMSRLVLLQGISGTGKTSLPRAFAAALGGEARVIPVQAGWRDRQDLIGYYNAFQRKYYTTEFLKALYLAGTPAYADRPFFIVLDEINLSRVEQFFADFLSALELRPDERQVTLIDRAEAEPPRLFRGGRHLPIPGNVWFVGTANHDETTTGFADKTIDRAHVMELPRRDVNKEVEAHRVPGRPPVSYAALVGAFGQAQRDHGREAATALAWLRSEKLAETLGARFRVGWGNRLDDQARRFIPVWVGAGGTAAEALDHLLATRILRKLVDRHDVRPSALVEFRDSLVSSWSRLDPSGTPQRSVQLLDREVQAKTEEQL